MGRKVGTSYGGKVGRYSRANTETEEMQEVKIDVGRKGAIQAWYTSKEIDIRC